MWQKKSDEAGEAAIHPGRALAGAALALGVLLALGAPLAAETVTRSTHDDWTVRCAEEQGKKACEAVQTLQTQDLKSILAHVAVRAEKGGPVRLIVQVPPGVWLPANITFKVEGVKDILLTYKRCGQNCVASTELSADEIAALQASAGKGELVFENGSRQPIQLPLSFKGLGEAMRASLKD